MRIDIQLWLRQVREERAAGVKPGTEQEMAWHAIVPAEFRREPPSHSVQAPALPSLPETETNPINPS
jgi:hypothetical protein